MKKVLLFINILLLSFAFGCKLDEIDWEEVITEGVISDIIIELDTENKIFINVLAKDKMVIPKEYKDNEIIWEYDKDYLKLDNDIFKPMKNGTTIISGIYNNKKHIYVININNYSFTSTIQYNLKINYLFTTNNKKIGKKFNPNMIVVHNTANVSSAHNEVKWLSNITNTSTTSFHFAVDDNEVYQAIPTSNWAYHAGNYDINLKSIGIEIAKSKITDETIKNTAINNAVLLIKLLMNYYDINIDNVITHQDASGKICPHDIIERYGLLNFYNDINEV